MITASLVKELRETTGAGMLDCKKALEETNGNLEAAIDYLREKGISKAAKKSDRIAAEGISALKEVGTSASEILTQLSGGIQSGMGYLGARNLVELKEKARYIRVTQAGYLESRPHNVIEIKSNPTAK